MKFSLVMATVGRSSELKRFLECLAAQSYRDFELIVVDQNPDERLLPFLSVYSQRFPIVHCKSRPGLSRARNAGLRHISGDVVAFPDDDCWYLPPLLEDVAGFLSGRGDLDGVTVRLIDPGVHGLHSNRGLISRLNVFRRALSCTIFLREKVVRAVGDFNESLGLGADTGKIGLEETDYLIRAISASFKIWYEPQLSVFHGDSELRYDNASIQRQYGNGLAFGSVLRKHGYDAWFVAYCWLRPLAGVCLSLVTLRLSKAQYHFAAFRGRVAGWLSLD